MAVTVSGQLALGPAGWPWLSSPDLSLERIHSWAENFSPSEKPLTPQMPLICQSEGLAYHLSHFSPRLAAQIGTIKIHLVVPRA